MKNPEVDAWFEQYDNPMKDVVLAVRDIILSVEGIEESIKWKSPSFRYKKEMATFFPRSKKHASLMFHKGAFIPGNYTILEGDAKEGRSAKFHSLDDVKSKRIELLALVQAWKDLMDS